MVSQSDLRKENGNKKNWSIRKNIHEDTRYGRSKLYQFTSLEYISEAIEHKNLIVSQVLKKRIKKLSRNGNQDKEIIEILKKDNIKELKIYEPYVKSRFQGKIDSSFNEKKINKITDTSIQRILINHLNNPKYINQKDDKGNSIKPEDLAFSTQGLKEMNDNIQELNNGKTHKPIFNVSLFKKEGEKFRIGNRKQTKTTFVNSVAGSNAFCGVYEKESQYGTRAFETPKIKDSIEAITNGERYPLEEKVYYDGELFNLRFVLEPNDLVYIPTEDEIEMIKDKDGSIKEELLKRLRTEVSIKDRIYKFNNASKGTLRFLPQSISSPILQLSNANLEKLKKDNSEVEYQNLIINNELGGKSAKSDLTREIIDNRLSNSQDLQIKDYCIKLNVDKLGRIQSLEL